MIIKKKQISNNSIPKNLIGVYYFISSDDKIIYIGKSIDIKKRIEQHMRNGRKRMILRFDKLKITKLSTELEALLFESQEIKKHKPIFNRRLRRQKNMFSLFHETNKYSYPIYSIGKVDDNSLINFMSKRQAKIFLERISKRFNLCDKLNGLENTKKCCFKYHLKICKGACICNEKLKHYKKRFNESLSYIFKFPNNCKITFYENNLKTEVSILNNHIVEFGIKNKKKYNIEFNSYDEMRIVKGYHRKYPEKLLEIKKLN